MKFDESIRLGRRLHAAIPGGAHTYAKGDDQFPEHMAPVIERGLGSHVFDVDGNEFIEYGSGLRAVVLGHAHPSVVRAAKAAMDLGTNFVRPARIELECAEAFLDLVPGAEMVKFCKNGSDATSGAVRLARSYTGRDLVGYCSDQPFFSVDDWFIGTTDFNSGIPKAIQELSLGFRYNDLDSARQLFERNPGRIACLILEAAKNEEPAEGFLEDLRDLCHAQGALLVFDEMITGFRWHAGGAQTLYGVTPDLSTFGKAFGNGFALSALAGRREIMERGGLEHDAERVFLLSTTHGAETHALAAGLEVIRIFREEPVIETMERRGERLRAGVAEVASKHGVADQVEAIGRPQCMVFTTRDAEGRPSQPMRTLFLQETLRRGLLMPSIVLSYAHSEEDIDRTIEGFDHALEIYARALNDGVDRYLEGRPVAPVFRRYNDPSRS